MDTSKYKDILGKLSFLTDYSSLLAPVIITVVALSLLAISALTGSKLTGQIIESSVSTGKKIQSLSRNSPARDQWKLASQYQQACETDANQIELLAKQSTQRHLLSYRIFPQPKDTSALIFKQFGHQYRRYVEELLAGINALDCPSDLELDGTIRGSGSRTAHSRFAPTYPASPARGSFFGSSSGKRRVADKITEVLCREKAESACVYCNASDLAGYDYWNEYKYKSMKEDTDDCWYRQLAYWIIEDVIDTIGSVNSNSDSVYTSPVKRLLTVNFAGEKSSRMTAQTIQKCEYVFPLTKTLEKSCTQRICSDDIDVVHFNVEVIVSAKAVLAFMKELCSVKEHRFEGWFGGENEQVFKHNQITILRYDMTSVDRQQHQHRLYRYGQDAVVKLSLLCEYIFNKDGYEAIKPESVRESMQKLMDQTKTGRR